MVRIVLMAEVKNLKDWEAGFRKKTSLFQQMTQRVAHYGVTDKNEVVLYLEVDDHEKYMSVLLSPAVADAMTADGVRMETARFYVLDRTLES